MKMRFTMYLRHGISIVVALIAAVIAYKVPLNTWFNNTFFLWIVTIVLVGCSVGGGYGSQWF